MTAYSEAGEPGIAGWTIFLDPTATASWIRTKLSTQTDAEGRYTFANLLPGSLYRGRGPAGRLDADFTLDHNPSGLAGFNTSSSGVSMESLGCG